MSFDRTLALRLQLTTNFAAASVQAADGLQAIVKGLKDIKSQGTIDIKGLTNLKTGADAASIAAQLLAQRSREASLAQQQVSSTAREAAAAIGGALVPAFTRATAAADKAARAAAGFARGVRDLNTISINPTMFNGLNSQVALATTRVLALEDKLLSLSRMRFVAQVAIETVGRPMLPPGTTEYQYRAIPLSSGNSMPPPPRQTASGGYGENYPVPVPGGYYYPANSGGAGGGLPPGGGTGGGGGLTPPSPFNWGRAGKGMWSLGSNMSSMGMSGVMNAALMAPFMKELLQNMSDIDDLLARTKTAFSGTPQLADQFNQFLLGLTAQYGGDFKETVGAGYNMTSSLPEFNYNSKAGLQALQQMYLENLKMQIVGSSSLHPINLADVTYNSNAIMKHFFGGDAKDPAKFAQDHTDVSNTLTNLMLSTATEIDKASNSFRQVGPMARSMGISFSDIAAMIGILAQNKTVGNEAGTAIKRILSRQNAPSGQLEKVMQVFAAHGMDISLYDSKGQMRSPLEMFDNIWKAEQGLTPQERAHVNQSLSGLYAVKDFSNLLNTIHEMGGAKAAHDYGVSLVKGGGKDGRDALETAYQKRLAGGDNTGNIKIEGQKAMGAILKELYKTFQLIKPDLASFLHDVTIMVGLFDKLPDPVKKFLVEGALFTAFLNGGIGVMGLFVGNILKMGGGFFQLIGWLKQFPFFADLFTKLGGVFKLFGLGVIGVIRAIGIAMLTNPIGLAITALIALGLLLYAAWKGDWGHIREITYAVLFALGQYLKEGISQTKDFIAQMKQWWAKFGPTIVSAVEFIFPMLRLLNPQFRKAAWDHLKSMIDGAVQGGKDLIQWFKDLPGRIIGAITGFAGDFVNAGKAFVTNFAQGITNNAHAAVDAAKAVAQKVRDLHPGSEPKDTSSPYYNMKASGAALISNFASGFPAGEQVAVQGIKQVGNTLSNDLDSLWSGTKNGKTKKTKNPLADRVIEIKDETLDQIKQMTAAIEAAMKNAGAVLYDKNILVVQNGQVIGRMTAAPQAAAAAARVANHDPSAQQAADSLKEMKMAGASLNAQLTMLTSAFNKAIDGHAKAIIAGMITTTQKALAQFEAGIQAKFYGKGGSPGDTRGGELMAIDKDIQQATKDADSFTAMDQKYSNMLQQRIDLRKNKELPTLAELMKERAIELAQETSLTRINTQELSVKADLEKKIRDLTDDISKLNDNDAQQHDLKQKLLAQLDTYNTDLLQINTDLDTQAQRLTQVNNLLKQNTADMQNAANAASAWERALVTAFDAAGKAALTQLGDTLSSGIDQMLEDAFGKWKGKGVSGTLLSAIGDFFSTFISSLLHGAVDNIMKNAQITLTNFFKNMQTIFGGSPAISGSEGAFDTSLISIAGFAGMTEGAAIGAKDGATGGGMASHMFGGAAGAIVGGGAALAAMFGLGAFGSVGIPAMLASLTPIGWAALGLGVLGGGMLGGMIGPNWGPPQNYPDRSDTTNYGQFMANFGGAGYNGLGHGYNANGTTFYEDPQLAQQLGNKGIEQYLKDYIAQTGGTGLDQNLINEFKNTNGETYLKNGMVSLGNGITEYWSQLQSDATKAMQEIQKGSNSLDQSASDAQRLADSFQTMMWGNPNGFVMPGYIGGNINNPPSVVPPPQSIVPGGSNNPISNPPVDYPTPGVGRTEESTGVTINLSLLEGAQVSSATLLDEIIALVPQLKQTLTNAVNEQMYRNSRLYNTNGSAIH